MRSWRSIPSARLGLILRVPGVITRGTRGTKSLPSSGPPSLSECPAQLDGNQFVVGHKVQVVRISNQFLPAAIPDNKQVIAPLDRPAQTRVRADVLRLCVVLHECG